MSFENLQQNFANATGFLYDRTCNPPRMIGQAFIVSKSRAVTCAGNVYNYSEAPWAITIHFPHPDLNLGVKAIGIHGDFDKREARNAYLNQTGSPLEPPPIQLNDLATLVMDAQLADMQPEKVAELNRALSIPFSSQGVEASGNVRGTELFSVMNTILESRRQGLLTLFDGRNIPIARVQIAPGHIQKVFFKGLTGEMAFAELVYRKPAEGYAFQPVGNFNWGNIRDVSVPTDQLIMESSRRANEMPQLLVYLASSKENARFQKTVQSFDPKSASDNIQWLAERLWNSLDGYITVDRLPERVGADLYTVCLALRELMNRGVISLLNRQTPFACGGQLGTPLVSHTDFDINPGDPLTAFYLDPLSGAPTWQQGNFFGVSSVLQPKNLLHTIPILPGASGALILKNYKLVGVHSGWVVPKAGQTATLPPTKVFQMMWIGALLDMSTRKLRASEGEDGEDGIAGLRTKALEESVVVPQEKLEKYTCPNCFSTNTKVGPCFNCGTVIDPPPPEPEPEGKLKHIPIQKLKKLKDKYGVTDQQLMIAAGIILGFPLLGMMFCSSPSQTVAPVPATDTTTQGPSSHANAEKAVQVAVEQAGFKATTPPGYWYEDTAEITKPSASFGLYSERANQKIIFTIVDDMSPYNNLENFTGKPAYTDVLTTDTKLVEEGNQILGHGQFKWSVSRYLNPKGGDKLVLTGAFPAPSKGKSVLVVGTNLKDATVYDYKSTLFAVDQMATDLTAKGNEARMNEAGKMGGQKGTGATTGTDTSDTTPAEKPIATDEEVTAYLKKMEELIQSKLVLPDEAQEEMKKNKPKKLRVTVTLGIDEEGNVKKIELTKMSELDRVNSAVEKAINANAPFKDVPNMKDDKLTVLVMLNKDKIKLERP